MGRPIRLNSTRMTKDAATVSRQVARQNKRAAEKAAELARNGK